MVPAPWAQNVVLQQFSYLVIFVGGPLHNPKIANNSVRNDDQPRPTATGDELRGYLFRKPAGHREVAPREFDMHSRWKPTREQKREEEEEEAVNGSGK